MDADSGLNRTGFGATNPGRGSSPTHPSREHFGTKEAVSCGEKIDRDLRLGTHYLPKIPSDLRNL